MTYLSAVSVMLMLTAICSGSLFLAAVRITWHPRAIIAVPIALVVMAYVILFCAVAAHLR